MVHFSNYRRRHAFAACVSLSLSLVVLHSVAGAQPAQPTTASADQLFDDGRKAMTQGHFDVARKYLEASQKADPAAGTLLNLAECYEKLNRLATAWETYAAARDAAKLKKGKEDWVQLASEHIAALTPRLPKVRVTGRLPASARLELDGKPFTRDPGGAGVPLDPAPHRLVAYDGTRELQARDFTAKEGLTSEVAFDIAEPAAPAVPVAPVAPVAPVTPKPPIGGSGEHAPDSAAGPSPLVWVLGGASVASFAVGGVLLLVRNGQVSDAVKKLNDEKCVGTINAADAGRCNDVLTGERENLMGFAPPAVAFAVGGAFAISAVALYFATKSDANSAQARAMCAPGFGGGACIVHF